METKKLIVSVDSKIRYHIDKSYRDKTKTNASNRYYANHEKMLKYMRDWRKRNPKRASSAVARWISRNRERYNEMQKNARIRRRVAVIDAYGGKCSCCSEHRQEFLTVEHTFKNGADHRKKIKGIYRWLIKNKFPKEGFTLLCYNCNMAEGRDNICPHKIEKGITETGVLELHKVSQF